ncbi:hypothetical protein GGI06_005548, partial [Coemansia sp. S85]
SRELLVSDSVQARFVAVLTEQLAAAPAALSTLLDVPLCLAQSAVPVLPALARAVIPVLAKLAYAQDEPGVVLDKTLDVLVAFATARYAEPGQSGLVMAAVLMVLLSMLPDEQARGVGRRDACLVESILGLATRAPESFKGIVVKLSVSQPTAKRRLELAIRSRSSTVAAVDTVSVEPGSLTQDIEWHGGHIYAVDDYGTGIMRQ